MRKTFTTIGLAAAMLSASSAARAEDSCLKLYHVETVRDWEQLLLNERDLEPWLDCMNSQGTNNDFEVACLSFFANDLPKARATTERQRNLLAPFCNKAVPHDGNDECKSSRDDLKRLYNVDAPELTCGGR
jgi:hypothetical protein